MTCIRHYLSSFLRRWSPPHRRSSTLPFVFLYIVYQLDSWKEQIEIERNDIFFLCSTTSSSINYVLWYIASLHMRSPNTAWNKLKPISFKLLLLHTWISCAARFASLSASRNWRRAGCWCTADSAHASVPLPPISAHPIIQNSAISLKLKTNLENQRTNSIVGAAILSIDQFPYLFNE